MLWKAGLLTLLIGLTLTFASCAFFGNAIMQAAETRQVATADLQPGQTSEVGPVLAQAGTQARVRIEADLRLSEEAVEGSSDRGTIVSLSLPVNYQVKNDAGGLVHVESGRLSGSKIVPASDSPHRGSFEPIGACSFQGSGFEVPQQGRLHLVVELPGADDGGNAVIGGRAVVSDRLPQSAGRWVAGGFASIVLGPVVGLIGAVLLLVGLIVRLGSKGQP
jgi:uncharacterized protein involved in high-affinity Fe2+ transport